MERTERDRAVCELAFEVSRTFSKVCLKLYGTSMVLAMWPGDVVTVERRATSELRCGQVVVCRTCGGLLAHRIVRIEGDSLVLQGDSLERVDPPVSGNQVLGVVTEVERGGTRKNPELTAWRKLMSFAVRRSEACKHLVLRLGNAQPFVQGQMELLLR